MPVWQTGLAPGESNNDIQTFLLPRPNTLSREFFLSGNFSKENFTTAGDRGLAFRNGILQLSDKNASYCSGAVAYAQPLYMGAFSTRVTFVLTRVSEDGVAVCFQNFRQNVLGGRLGFEGVPQSVMLPLFSWIQGQSPQLQRPRIVVNGNFTGYFGTDSECGQC